MQQNAVWLPVSVSIIIKMPSVISYPAWLGAKIVLFVKEPGNLPYQWWTSVKLLFCKTSNEIFLSIGPIHWLHMICSNIAEFDYIEKKWKMLFSDFEYLILRGAAYTHGWLICRFLRYFDFLDHSIFQRNTFWGTMLQRFPNPFSQNCTETQFFITDIILCRQDYLWLQHWNLMKKNCQVRRTDNDFLIIISGGNTVIFWEFTWCI